MLSVRHHLLFWLVAITAALIYTSFRQYFHLLPIQYMLLLAPILLAEPALLVWHGPARSLDYKKHPHMLKRIYIPSSCGILLSLGRLVDLMFGSTQAELQRNMAGTVVHALLAFAYIGLVESIRQNASIPLPPSSLAVARGD